ncbi:MAG: DUF6526 family protein [Acidobacteriota bacterium]
MNNQDYSNHTRWYPLNHFVIAPISLGLIIFQGWRAFQSQETTDLITFVIAILILLLALAARLQALKAQDRVIRLEERLRLKELIGPEDAKAAGSLPPGMLIAIRFASDEELPELARRAVAGEFKNPGDLKRAIKNWRADHHRV